MLSCRACISPRVGLHRGRALFIVIRVVIVLLPAAVAGTVAVAVAVAVSEPVPLVATTPG